MLKKVDSAYKGKPIGSATMEAEGFVAEQLPEDEYKPESKFKKERKLKRISLRQAKHDALNAKSATLVKSLLDVGGVSVVYGPSNVGKSFLMAELGNCVRPPAGRLRICRWCRARCSTWSWRARAGLRSAWPR